MQRGPCHVYAVAVLNCVLRHRVETCATHSLRERFGEHIVLRIAYTLTNTDELALFTLQALVVLGGRLCERLTYEQHQRRRPIHFVLLTTTQYTYYCTLLTSLYFLLTRNHFHIIGHT